MLPLPCVLAHRITRLLMITRVDNVITGLLPDCKAQVTVEYEGGQPSRVEAVIIYTQHDAQKDVVELRQEITNITPRSVSGFPTG